jgi:hypothetical protein
MFLPTRLSPEAKTVPFDGIDVFGYQTAVTDRTVVMIEGKGVPSLWVGMFVTLVGDTRGHVPGDFKDGETATIIGFQLPGEQGESDHIIEVTNGEHIGFVKPSNIRDSRV